MTHDARTPRLDAPGAFTVRIATALHDCPWWPCTDRPGDARCYVFQCADVLEAWCASIGRARNVQPLFVTIFGADGGPLLLLPLGIEEALGVRILRFLDGGVSDYNAPVVFPANPPVLTEDIDALSALLCRHLPPFDVAVLEKMPEKIEEGDNPLTRLTTRQRPESCHSINLNGTWDEFTRERAKLFADSRRRRAKLEKLGRVRVEIADDAATRETFLDAMTHYKRQKFLDTKGCDVFTDPGYGAYYPTVTRLLGAGSSLHLSALYLDDRILAAHWGFVFGDRFYHLMPAHAAGEWRPYAPGRLLNEWLIEWSFQQGLRFFDFCIGDEPYKFDYCDTHVALRDAVIPITAKGGLYAAMLQMTSAAKNVLIDTPVGEALRTARGRWRHWTSGAAARPTPTS